MTEVVSISKEHMLRGLRDRMEMITSVVERGHLDCRIVWPTLTKVADFRSGLLLYPDDAEPGEVFHRYIDVIVSSSEDFNSWFRSPKNG